MDFDFSQEQYMFRDSTRGFLEQSYDLTRMRRGIGSESFDQEFWEGLAATGAFSILIPEDHGGLGLGFVDLALVLEEYGRALVPSPVPETLVCTDAIVSNGTDEQKALYLPAIAEGKLRAVPAIAETDAGYGTGSLAVTAIASGNGWRLSGSKILVPQAQDADLILVATRFGDSGETGLAIVERARAGVSFRRHETLDPANPCHEVSFADVSVAAEDILGGTPRPDSVDRLLDACGLVAAAMLTGICGKVLDQSVAYAAQRTQFGKPIGSFQAIKHRCADMAVAIDASRSAAYYAAWAVAENSADRARAVSIAKSYCGDTSRFVCNEGVQIHGGIGFTWDLGLHFYLRRAKMLEYAHGDAAYHRERVLALTLAELGVRPS